LARVAVLARVADFGREGFLARAAAFFFDAVAFLARDGAGFAPPLRLLAAFDPDALARPVRVARLPLPRPPAPFELLSGGLTKGES
jgi:hypothetical protein